MIFILTQSRKVENAKKASKSFLTTIDLLANFYKTAGSFSRIICSKRSICCCLLISRKDCAV